MDYFPHLYCYLYNVSADIPSGMRQESSRVRKEGSRVRQEIPEEGRRVYRPKRCTDNNEDEDNSPNNTDNSNHQASSQTFREMEIYFINILGKGMNPTLAPAMDK